MESEQHRTQVLYVDEPARLDRQVSTLAAVGDGFEVQGAGTASEAHETLVEGRTHCLVVAHDPPERDVVDLLDAAGAVPVVLYATPEGPLFEATAGRVAGFVERTGAARVAELAAAIEAAVATGSPEDSVPDLAVIGEAVDAIDDVFYVYDETGGLTHWNARLNHLFGLTDAELHGMHATEFFLPADHEAIAAGVTEALTTGATVTEARAQTVDGLRTFQLTGRALTDESGATVGFCGIGRDVTDSREREWRLCRQNERLEEFAAVVSHDLRNPLTVAKGFLDVARRDEEGETPALDRVDAALDRMDRLIDDVLTAARDGREVTETAPVDVGVAARRAWRNVDTADATLDVQATAVIDADADRLSRLFENLFRNAVEHGSTGSQNAARSDDAVEHGSTNPDSQARQDAVEHAGPTVSVVVTGTPEGFAVSDDGPGIPEAERERVFEPGVSGAARGTGFGLYIVRTIAEAHGWAVDVTESEAGGARFRFTVDPDREDAD